MYAYKVDLLYINKLYIPCCENIENPYVTL